MRIEDKWGKREYIAVSHVWGEAKREFIPIADGELMVSREKSRFLEFQLQSIIGNSWFWMDILSINQFDPDEKVRVTQYIPSIFRFATKTLVVRESSGIGNGSGKAVQDVAKLLFNSLDAKSKLSPFSSTLFEDHPSLMPNGEDGILTRLWPLQEIMLSDNLQFIRCNGIEGFHSKTNGLGNDRAIRMLKNVFNLAFNWKLYRTNAPYNGLNGKDIMPFVKAFIENGSVTRAPIRDKNDDEYISAVVPYCHTPRRTTKARDFILAIMPQCYWYTVPSEAKRMTFGRLFFDMCVQAKKAGDEHFSPLITNRTPLMVDIIFDPTPTEDVPTPQTLFEFMSLLVGLQSGIRLLPLPVHLAVYSVEIRNALEDLNLPNAFDVIASTMRLSSPLWQSTLVANDTEDGLLAIRGRNPAEWDINWHRDYFKILSLFFQLGLTAANMISAGSRNCIEAVRRHLERTFIREDLHCLLRLASSVSCGFGIDTSNWSIQKLTPILITFRGSTVLALAYKTLVNQRSLGQCKFSLLDIEGAKILVAKEERTSGYIKCFYPSNTDVWGDRLGKKLRG